MTLQNGLLVALGGAIGSLLRYAVGLAALYAGGSVILGVFGALGGFQLARLALR